MAYTPTDWKNREVEKPRTFQLQNNPDSTVTLIPKEGNVIEAGTPIIADNMNKMEQGIKDAHDGLAAIGNVSEELNEHKAERASKTEFGHVKVGDGLSVVDGVISADIPEMTADNVTTVQGPSVQETLDTLKSDTDNKIESVATAIVSKGGEVAGSPPTAQQLVDGVESIPSVGFVEQDLVFMNNHVLNSVDGDNNFYLIEPSAPFKGRVFVKNMNMILEITPTVSRAIRSISKYGYYESTGNSTEMALYDLNKTLIRIIVTSGTNAAIYNGLLGKVSICYKRNSDNQWVIIDLNGTLIRLTSIILTHDLAKIFLNKKDNFIIMQLNSSLVPQNAYKPLINKTMSITVIANHYYGLDLPNW